MYVIKCVDILLKTWVMIGYVSSISGYFEGRELELTDVQDPDSLKVDGIP